jgi:hypothetical protein
MSQASLLENLGPLAQAGVRILHVCGSLDPGFADNTQAMEKKYKALGGAITVVVEEGAGHYPTSPRNPQAVVDFIEAGRQ